MTYKPTYEKGIRNVRTLGDGLIAAYKKAPKFKVAIEYPRNQGYAKSKRLQRAGLRTNNQLFSMNKAINYSLRNNRPRRKRKLRPTPAPTIKPEVNYEVFGEENDIGNRPMISQNYPTFKLETPPVTKLPRIPDTSREVYREIPTEKPTVQQYKLSKEQRLKDHYPQTTSTNEYNPLGVRQNLSGKFGRPVLSSQETHIPSPVEPYDPGFMGAIPIREMKTKSNSQYDSGFYTESNKPKRQIEKLRTRQEIKPTPWESQFNQMNQGIKSNNDIKKNPGFFKETQPEFNKEKSRYEQDLTPPTSSEFFKETKPNLGREKLQPLPLTPTSSQLIIEKSKPKKEIEKLRNKEEIKLPPSIPWESQFGQNEQENKIKENPGFYKDTQPKIGNIQPKRTMENIRNKELKSTWESQFNQMEKGIKSNLDNSQFKKDFQKNPGFYQETQPESEIEKSRLGQRTRQELKPVSNTWESKFNQIEQVQRANQILIKSSLDDSQFKKDFGKNAGFYKETQQGSGREKSRLGQNLTPATSSQFGSQFNQFPDQKFQGSPMSGFFQDVPSFGNEMFPESQKTSETPNPGFYEENNKPKTEIEKLKNKQELKPIKVEMGATVETSDFLSGGREKVEEGGISKNARFGFDMPSEISGFMGKFNNFK